MTLNEELLKLCQQVKKQEKEIRYLKKENDFWKDAYALIWNGKFELITDFVVLRNYGGLFFIFLL